MGVPRLGCGSGDARSQRDRPHHHDRGRRHHHPRREGIGPPWDSHSWDQHGPARFHDRAQSRGSPGKAAPILGGDRSDRGAQYAPGKYSAEKMGNGEEPSHAGEVPVYHSLNDAVVGRGAVARLVRISAFIDGAHLTDFRADAVIVATSYGQHRLQPFRRRAYPASLSERNNPQTRSTPCRYGASAGAPPNFGDRALRGDGPSGHTQPRRHVDLELAPGDGVRVQMSPYKALFLRQILQPIFMSPSPSVWVWPGR